MKKLLFSMLILFSALSCSDDDIDPKIPQTGEIKVIFEAKDDNSTVDFFIRGNDITINWGDGKTSTNSDISGSEISHQYEKLNREYIITIKASKIENFGNTTNYSVINHIGKTLRKIKSISFGPGVDIGSCNLQSSGINELAFNETSKIGIIYALLNDNWDTENFKNCNTSIYLYLSTSRDITIKNSNITGISLMLNRNVACKTVNIESCPDLTAMYVGGHRDILYGENLGYITITTSIADLIVKDTPKLYQLLISTMNLKSFDISNSNANMKSLDITNISVDNPILFCKNIEKIIINTKDILPVNNKIKVLDISMCETLIEFAIGNLPALEEIKTSDKNIKLKTIGINTHSILMNKIKKLDFSNLPKLYYLRFDGRNKTDILESINLSNCPELSHLILHNTNLKSITINENNNIKFMQIDNNNLDESQLKNVIGSLVNDGKNKDRSLYINGNPGITNQVKEKCDELSDWKVTY